MSTKTSISFLKDGNSVINRARSYILAALLLSATLLPSLTSSVLAQMSNSNRIITYQAQILKKGEPVPDGKYTITASLYNDAEGMNLIWRSTYVVDVNSGIANLMLGEVNNGGVPLPEVGLDGPLYLGISVGSSTGNLTGLGEEMRPLTRLSSSPNALSVADSSITSSKIAADYISGVTVDGQRVTSRGGELKLVTGAGIAMKYDKESEALTLEIPQAQTANGTGSASTTNTCISNNDAGQGTNQVSGGCGNTIYANSGTVPIDYSTISGGQDNTITSETDDNENAADEGTWWHTIGGGLENEIVVDIKANDPTQQKYMGASTIGGGEQNLNVSPWGTIAGGRKNAIAYAIPTVDNEQGRYLRYNVIAGGDSNRIMLRTLGSVIGGGSANYIAAPNGLDSAKFITISGGDTNKVRGTGGVIGGGHKNTILSEHDVISGGNGGNIGSNSDFSTIGGGVLNDISDAANSTIGGGDSNTLRSNNTTIGGGSSNRINPSSHYSAISGGSTDSILSQYAFVGGGHANTVGTSSNYAVIGGGNENKTKDAAYAVVAGGKSNIALADHSSISGGEKNEIQLASFYSAISGGYTNSIDGSAYAAISGGAFNFIDEGAPYSAIGGGRSNRVEGRFSTISGGDSNQINHVEADHNFTGGGLYNVQNNPSFGTIGGGRYNLLDTNAWASMIGGGEYNIVRSSRSFLGGGSMNEIEEFDLFSTLVGGEENSVWAEHAFLGGGYRNLNHDVFGVLVGGSEDTLRSAYSFLGGGRNNMIDWNSDSAVLVGGAHNYINFGTNSFIGGGLRNWVGAERSFLGAGCDNSIMGDTSIYSTLPGGCSNVVSDAFGSLLGGGHNSIKAGYYNSVGGGLHNSVESSFLNIGKSDYCTIAGGSYNIIDRCTPADLNLSYIPFTYRMPDYATISGGSKNSAKGHYSTVSGGAEDTARGMCSTIPGGFLLSASDFQTVIGHSNKHSGMNRSFQDPNFIDGVNASFPDPFEFLFIIGNGRNLITGRFDTSNAFEVSENGHSIVHHTNNSGGATLGASPVNPAIIGATYVDNVILAWGEVSAAGAAVSDFGVFQVTMPVAGVYKIDLNVTDAYSTVQKMINQASITVTVLDDAEPESGSAACGYATASKIRTTLPGGAPAPHPYFYVRTYSGQQTVTVTNGEAQLTCNSQTKPFMFKVTGR